MPKKRPAPPPSDDTITHEPPTVATHILTSRDGPAGREVHRAENEAPAHCIDERARASWEQSLSVGDPYGARTYRSIENIWGAGGVEDQKLDALVKARPGQRSIEEVLRIVLRFVPDTRQKAKGGAIKALLLEHVDEVVGAQATRARRVDLDTMVRQFERGGEELARRDPYMAGNVAALALILFGQCKEALQRCTPRKPRVAVFGSAKGVLAAARGEGIIGMGPQNYQIAESRGRTRSLWSEVGCRGTTHTGTGSVKSLAVVERAADAENALAGAGLDSLDRAALEALADGAKMAEVVPQYGAALPPGEVLSHEAIKQRIKRARKQAEIHLRRLPALAEQTARAMGDKSFLQSIIPPVKERSQKPAPAPVAPILSTLARGYV